MKAFEWTVRGALAAWSLWLLYRANREGHVTADVALFAAWLAIMACLMCGGDGGTNSIVSFRYDK